MRADLVGQRFGRLVVVRYNGAVNARGYWLCQCDCGREKVTTAHRLKTGRAVSCNCWRNEQSGNRTRTHGGSHTSEHFSWMGMRKRCTSPADKRYARYGGRGIRVCERWDSFENFLADMGPRPGPGYSIDRIDNDGDYTPENCRWTTWTVQQRNRSSSIFLEVNGERRPLVEWAALYGITPSTLRLRIKKGMAPEVALTTPVRVRLVPLPPAGEGVE